jgi:hypothetical protein
VVICVSVTAVVSAISVAIVLALKEVAAIPPNAYITPQTVVGSNMMSFVKPVMTTTVMVRTSVVNVTAARAAARLVLLRQFQLRALPV